MRSLTLKLILTFLVISLVQAGLVAFFARQAAERAFDWFLREEALEQFTEIVTTHYRARGTWAGIAETVQRTVPGPRGRFGGPPDGGPPSGRGRLHRRSRTPFALVDPQGYVLIPTGPYRPGARVGAAVLAEGTPVTVDGAVVGTVLRNPAGLTLSARERAYLEQTLRAIALAALVGLGIAVLLGTVLARGITQPLRRLTAAAQRLARGAFGEQVPVRSRDEVGTLTHAFNQMSTDLQHADDLRRQMTADVAHELRTPLTVLTGYLEALRDGDLPPTPARFDTMHREVLHLNRLVQDLRTLSLADAGQLPLQREAVPPQALLARTREAFDRQARAQQVELALDVPPALPALDVDAGRMEQVLANLVSNALRHTPAGGRITLAAHPAGPGRLALQVRDTGGGIPAAALPHLFDRFYRADASRHREGSESGLGLAIVRSIVEAHGGTVTAASPEGRGAVFTLTLPAAEAGQEER